MAEPGDGLASAVASALDEAGPLLFPDPDQVELALGDRPRTPDHIREAQEEVRRRVGRPKGSPNRRTAKIRDYLLSRYTHPLEVLAATAAQPDDHLAAELGIKAGEARALRIRAAAELAPYLEGKMPVTVDLRGEGHMTLILGAAAAPAAPGGAAGPVVDQVPTIAFAAAETAENRGFSGADREQSE